MNRAQRRGALAAVLALIAALAAAYAWIDARARPDRVAARFAAKLADRHPGSTVQPNDGLVRAQLPSGVVVDVRIGDVDDACESSKLGCGGALDAALDAVDRVDAATRAPRREQLRAVVVGEPGGYRFGYVGEPLVGPYEVRYALVDGAASTFATGAVMDRLGLANGAWRAVARDAERREPADIVERAGDASPIFRVRAAGDAAASLLDRDRMTRVATAVGARRLYAAIPVRGTLLVAAAGDANVGAMERAIARARRADARTADGGILLYDLDAPDGQSLSIAPLSSALRLP